MAFRNHSLCIVSHGRCDYSQVVATWMRVDHCGVLSIGPIKQSEPGKESCRWTSYTFTEIVPGYS